MLKPTNSWPSSAEAWGLLKGADEPLGLLPPEATLLDLNVSQEAGLRHSDYLQERWHALSGEESPLLQDWLRGSNAALLKQLGLGSLKKQHLLALSNGEFRKARLARALLAKPSLLVLVEPLAGLDAHSRSALKKILSQLPKLGLALLIIASRRQDLPSGLKRVLNSGPKAAKQPSLKLPRGLAKAGQAPDPLLEFRKLSIRYGQRKVFSNFNWKVKHGQRWLLQGPNGSGKSTLVSLIQADHPQSYANDITLFGLLRGSGESIWDIKRHLGSVSPELHAYIPGQLSLQDLIRSGFFSSLGLYRQTTVAQDLEAAAWLQALGLEKLAAVPFSQASLFTQRLALLGRALVNQPSLLLLDESAQGLNERERKNWVKLIGQACAKGGPALIYVTHRDDEIPACINRTLKLKTKN